MSDHITYLCSALTATPTSGATFGGRRAGRGRASWHKAHMDPHLLTAAVMVSEWTVIVTPPETPFQFDDAEVEAEHLVRCMTVACDLNLLPRNSHPAGDLRSIGGTAKLQTRERNTCIGGERKPEYAVKGDSFAVAATGEAYRSACRALKRLIRVSKKRC